MQVSALATPPSLESNTQAAAYKDGGSTRNPHQPKQDLPAESEPNISAADRRASPAFDGAPEGRAAQDAAVLAFASTRTPPNESSDETSSGSGGFCRQISNLHGSSIPSSLDGLPSSSKQPPNPEPEASVMFPSTSALPTPRPDAMPSPSHNSTTSEEEGMIREEEAEEEEGAVDEFEDVSLSIQPSSPRRSLADRFSAAPPPLRRWGQAEVRPPMSFSSHPRSSSSSSSSRDRDSLRTRERDRERDRGWDRQRDKDWDLEVDRERDRDRGRLTAPSSRPPVARAFEEPSSSRIPRGGDSYRPSSGASHPQIGHRSISGDPANDSILNRDRDSRGRKSLSPPPARERELRDERQARRDMGPSPATPLSGSNSIAARLTPMPSPAVRDDLDRWNGQSLLSSSRQWGGAVQPSRWNKWANSRDREGREQPDTRRKDNGDDEKPFARSHELLAERANSRSLALSEEGPRVRRMASPPNASAESASHRRCFRSSPSPVTARSVRSQSITAPPSSGDPASPTSSRGIKAASRPPLFEPPQSDSGWGLKAKKTPGRDSDTSAVNYQIASATSGPLDASGITTNKGFSDGRQGRLSVSPAPEFGVVGHPSRVPDDSVANAQRDNNGGGYSYATTLSRQQELDTSVPPITASFSPRPFLHQSWEEVKVEFSDFTTSRDLLNAEDKDAMGTDAAQEAVHSVENKSSVHDTLEAAAGNAAQTDTRAAPPEGSPMEKDVQTGESSLSVAVNTGVSPSLSSASAAPTLPVEAQTQASVDETGPFGKSVYTPVTKSEESLTKDSTLHVDEIGSARALQEVGSYFPTFNPESLGLETVKDANDNLTPSADLGISSSTDQSAAGHLSKSTRTISPAPTREHLCSKKVKREMTPLPAQKSQEELDDAKRATVHRLLLDKNQLSHEKITTLLDQNRHLAEQTTFNFLESAIHGPPFSKPEYTEQAKFYVEDPGDIEQERVLLMKRLGARNRRLQDKVERLRKRYRSLDADWKAHCARLDRAAEIRETATRAMNQVSTPGHQPQQQHQPGVDDEVGANDGHRHSSILGGASIMSGRGNRRGTQSGFGFGDAVRSEAEFLEILASLESADMQDPEARAARTATTVPDQFLNADRDFPLKEDWDDRNGFVADPLAFYLDEFDPDHWSEEEKMIFARKYATWPKQFGKIASALPDKTPAQCVYYYYLTKHQPGHEYKAITAARNRSQKRKGKSKPKKGKGSALMADLKRGEDGGDEDDPGSPMDAGPLQARPTLLSIGESTLLPLTEVDESFEGQSAKISGRQRRDGEEAAGDGVDLAATPLEKPAKGKGGRKGKGQGKGKATNVIIPQAALSAYSPLSTPTVETPMDADLAAAEALGALSGVFHNQSPATPNSQQSFPAGKGKKRKATAEPVMAGGTESSSSLQRKVRSSTSSYWSIQERTEFLRAVVISGKDWALVASSLGAKSAAQARNYFARNAQVPEFIEAAQIGEENTHLPQQAREQMASDWVRDRIGFLTEEGVINKGFATSEVIQGEEATPRRGGMGIMSLLNDYTANDAMTRKKSSLQVWFGGETQEGQPSLPSSDDRIFSSGGALATEDDDSTDTEDPYAPSQYSSRSSTVIPTTLAYHQSHSVEPRPYLSDIRVMTSTTSMPQPMRPSLASQPPLPSHSVSSNNASLPRLQPSSTSSNNNNRRDPYADYSQYSRSQVYEIRNQLAPLVPLSSSRTGAAGQLDPAPFSRPGSLNEPGQVIMHGRSSASMPPPPNTGSMPPSHHQSWTSPLTPLSGSLPVDTEPHRQHLDLPLRAGSPSNARPSSASPYPLEAERHPSVSRGVSVSSGHSGNSGFRSPTAHFHTSLYSHSASHCVPQHVASSTSKKVYYAESSRPSSASASIPIYSSVRQGHQDINSGRGGNDNSRRPTSSDGRSMSSYPLPHHQQQSPYGPASPSRDLPMTSTAAASPPPTLPTPGSGRERDVEDARNGPYGSSYHWSGS